MKRYQRLAMTRACTDGSARLATCLRLKKAALFGATLEDSLHSTIESVMRNRVMVWRAL